MQDPVGTARAAAGEDSEMKALIEFQQVCKYYHLGDSTVTAADHLSFRTAKGDFVATAGPPDLPAAVNLH